MEKDRVDVRVRGGFSTTKRLLEQSTTIFNLASIEYAINLLNSLRMG